MFLENAPEQVTIILPEPHEEQRIFFDWHLLHPVAQVLVAPCGTKFGKSYGCSLWLAREALENPGSFCVWIAPTYLKAKIGYRYLKAMLNIGGDFVECLDGLLEIRFCNSSFIKFLHGKDAEVTVEGEGVDRFVIDEGGKTAKQLWYSLFTTITQTMGKGIITGTPKGFNWYYDVFRTAKRGDPFYCWAHLMTEDSPYVKPKAIEQAKRLLPKALFDQYYRAMFVSSGSVFGDLSGIWEEGLKIPEGRVRFWVHPDEKERLKDTIHGIDLAKMQDWTIFYSVNVDGALTGYCRFRHTPYTRQVQRVEEYLKRFYPKTDNHIRYDATGVGIAVGDILADSEVDASVTPVTFTNKSKQEMVTRTTIAIEQGWHKAPRIEDIEHEFASYEVSVTRSGLHSYAAPDGEHDDIVSAGMLAISGAYQSCQAEEAEKLLEEIMGGKIEKDEDSLGEYAKEAGLKPGDDDFFNDSDEVEDDFDFNEDTA